jgi:hypothetical protein
MQFTLPLEAQAEMTTAFNDLPDSKETARKALDHLTSVLWLIVRVPN